MGRRKREELRAWERQNHLPSKDDEPDHFEYIRVDKGRIDVTLVGRGGSRRSWTLVHGGVPTLGYDLWRRLAGRQIGEHLRVSIPFLEQFLSAYDEKVQNALTEELIRVGGRDA